MTNSSHFEEYKTKLLQMREEILSQLKTEQKADIIEKHYTGDELDVASEAEIMQLQQLLVQKDVEQLQQITYALKRIEEQSYEICEDCGEEIGKKRLLALLFTRLCIHCQSEQEKQ